MPEKPIVGDTDADSASFRTLSFIVRAWVEETTEEAGKATWRGTITLVPSGERQYLESLDDIARVIGGELAGLGVDPHGR